MEQRKIDSKDFGRRLRELRKEAGLSQPDLAIKAGPGFSQSNIGWLESGGAKDPRLQAQDLALHLNTTAEWLLYGTGTRNVKPAPMTPREFADAYAMLPMDERSEFSDAILQAMENVKKKKKRA